MSVEVRIYTVVSFRDRSVELCRDEFMPQPPAVAMLLSFAGDDFPFEVKSVGFDFAARRYACTLEEDDLRPKTSQRHLPAYLNLGWKVCEEGEDS